MTESVPLGRGEREAKGGGVAQRSHMREQHRGAAPRAARRDSFVAEGWAEKALAHGWSNQESFALPERWSSIDQCGVAWLVGERRVIGATADAIAIETDSGASLRFYRRAP
jgi:hypothetical protein